jgi:cation diffusion facilitator family transporter
MLWLEASRKYSLIKRKLFRLPTSSGIICEISSHFLPPEDLNIRSAMLHVLGDAAASCGVIVALIIWRTGWTLADPIASVFISLIIFASYRLISDSFRIMMEDIPSCLRLDDVSRAICSVPGVVQVHDPSRLESVEKGKL